MPGGRGRIGVVIPAGNAGMEYDFWKMAPEGVTVHFTRMKPTKGCEPTDEREFESELKEVFSLLNDVSEVIVYGRTYGTHKHAHVIKRASNKPLVLPEEEAVSVLRELNVKRLFVATPYIQKRTLEEASFFKENGFDITGYDGLNKVRGVDISNTAVFTIYRLVKRNMEAVKKSDAIYIACTALATYEASKYLHEDLGIPVVSENAVAMLGALNKIGVSFSPPGFRVCTQRSQFTKSGRSSSEES
ncbi:maleate cis-trans isomerase family protein [Sulfuracidifex tepidarius]|uniref:Maleate isomerase n=1 Tax=Sulfuracidifex tepidarius TaxID=1294262 RepID=A0A510DV81_9CREN|nr:arylmalonate decarboxylase [Sulfuracidifex tepidarius]BBG24133.1 Maleate isomerase [Sulfuracidifex tepidarius]BBG26889.1 Maleate isomerase [Sulfuracidifex tepidarius]